MILLLKCISIKQPYAELLAIGKKTIELRKWSIKFRGDFLIHTSKIDDFEDCEYYERNMILLPEDQ